MNPNSNFLGVGDRIIRLDDIASINLEALESHRVDIVLRDGTHSTLHGQPALDFVYRVAPQVLEGRRLRWVRHAWAFHNLVAHPAMQILAFMGLGKLGVKIHDKSVPRPR